MMNAFSQPQTIVLLGGSSEIGRAIVTALASPQLETVVLARRPGRGEPSTAAPIEGLDESVQVLTVPFDATDHGAHEAWFDELADRIGDLDVVVQAFGQLGVDAASDPAVAAALVEVNTAGAVSSGLAAAGRLRTQGHGTLIVLSSVAGVRSRGSNFVYGATKAGQDAFSTGLAAHLAGSGVHVLTVRPGFVRSRMTAGLTEAPFACDPSDVGAAVADAVRRRRRVVWVPGVLRLVFGVLRFAPEFVWRRLDR